MNKKMLTGVFVLAVLGSVAMAQPNTPVMQDAHALAFGASAIQRQVAEVPGGVKTITTTTDPGLLPVLRRHPRDMNQRYAEGGLVRRWDPLFSELAKVHGQIKYEVRDVENGVEVIATSEDANVARLIRAHAAKVTAMQQRGVEAMRETTPLPADYVPSNAAEPAACNAQGCRLGGQGARRGAVQNGRGGRYDASGSRGGCQGGCPVQDKGAGQMRRGQAMGAGQMGQGRGAGQMRRGQGMGVGQMGHGKGAGQMRRGQGMGIGQMGQGKGAGQIRGQRGGRGCGQGNCRVAARSNG